MTTKAMERMQKEREYYATIYQFLEENATGDLRFNNLILKAILESYERLISCVEEGKPFVASFYTSAPEIYAAMDLPWYCMLATPFMEGSAPLLMDDLEACDRMGLAPDMCTVLRLGAYYVDSGIVPVPTAIVALIEPCDGVAMMHQVIANDKVWGNIPMFGPDPPYWEDERSLEYFADQLREMTYFLEEHTGHKLDLDRLREVIEESNKQYELWAEYNELRRAVPCPHGSSVGPQALGITQNYMVGDPRGTAWFREVIADAEERVQAKQGGLEKERIRLLWFDVRPTWFPDVLPWLEGEWGANVVMDMFNYCPYTTIDTSSEESMFRGLAKRNLYDTPMIRQARGHADNFIKDIVRIVKDFKIDCVIWPGHMGHKDGAASIGMMREVCRDIGVPFLHIGLDLFDPRYTTVDEIKNRLSQFFTAMGLG